MPKMKTKSGAKKRFKFTATGLVIGTQAKTRHNKRKMSKRAIRTQRGTQIMNDVESRRVMRYFPYANLSA